MTQYDVIETPFEVRVAAMLYVNDADPHPITILSLGNDEQPISEEQHIAFMQALNDPTIIAVPGQVMVEVFQGIQKTWVFSVGSANRHWSNEDIELFREMLINAVLNIAGENIKEHRFIIGAV